MTTATATAPATFELDEVLKGRILALAERLQAKGKAQKATLCACMKKLLQIAFGVLKHGKDFDPNYTKQPANA